MGKFLITNIARLIVILNCEEHIATTIKKLLQFEKMDMSANGCDAYLDKLRKDCNDLVVEQHAMAVVKNELLPHTTGITWKNNSYRRVNGAPVMFFSL